MKVASALPCLLLVTPAWAKRTMTTTSVGSFSVVTQIDDSSEHPVPDVQMIMREVRLEWRSAHRRVRFVLKDDGRTLDPLFEVTKLGMTETVCARSGGALHSYQSLSRAPKDWQMLEADLAISLASACGKVLTVQQRQAYLDEFAATALDVRPAIDVMKAAAQQQFGGWQRRCLRFGYHGLDAGPPPCTRYSAK